MVADPGSRLRSGCESAFSFVGECLVQAQPQKGLPLNDGASAVAAPFIVIPRGPSTADARPSSGEDGTGQSESDPAPVQAQRTARRTLFRVCGSGNTPPVSTSTGGATTGRVTSSRAAGRRSLCRRRRLESVPVQGSRVQLKRLGLAPSKLVPSPSDKGNDAQPSFRIIDGGRSAGWKENIPARSRRGS